MTTKEKKIIENSKITTSVWGNDYVIELVISQVLYNTIMSQTTKTLGRIKQPTTKEILIDFIKVQTAHNSKVDAFINRQEKFNNKQEKINKNQKKFNDAIINLPTIKNELKQQKP